MVDPLQPRQKVLRGIILDIRNVSFLKIFIECVSELSGFALISRQAELVSKEGTVNVGGEM